MPVYNVEKHLKTTLDSIVNQSFQDYEVILINDGSTDSTEETIEEYCKKYPNFNYISQENQGVAVARNNGLKIAKGDYIGFLDGDGDVFTLNALENFDETLNKHDDPDLVIGMQTKIDPWGRQIYLNARKLSKLEIIEAHDKKLIWTMGLMNKVFKREVIEENNLKMPLSSYASDGGFVFPFAFSSSTIVGCPHEIILYNKRVFSDEYSISQTTTMKTFDDYLKIHDIIYKSFMDYSANYQEKYGSDKIKLEKFEEEHLIYLDALLHRQCSILIDQFYRFFWRTEEDVLQNTKKTIMSFKEEMFLASWEKLEKTNTDLNLMDLIIKKQDMVKNPHFTILISPNITKNSNLNLKDTLNQILTNIHNFTFPSFEVFIGENLVANLSNSFKSQEYVKIIKSEDEYEFKKNSLDVMKGKFVYYIDKNVLNPLTLLKIAFDNLNNKHPDFIEFNIKPYRDNDFNEIKNDNIYEFSKLQYLKSFNNDHYSYFSNKVFKADFIKKNEAIFLKNNEIAVNELYEVGNSIKNKKVSILTTDEYLKSPLISVIIDNMEIYEIELNRLFESIYKQNFKSFNVILNENLEKKLNDEFREKSNLIILKDDNFKEIAIKTSKAKYALFVNIPLNYNNNSLFKGLLNRMIDLNEDENVGFLSFPLMKLRISKGTKLIKSYYSQNFIYNDLWNSKYRSKFIKFDLHLSNKLFNLNTLKIKNIYFKSPDKDVLYLYKNFKNFKEYRMSILSYLSEINLFKSMIYEHFIILKFLLMKIYIFLFKYLYLISLFIKRKLKKY